MISWKNSVKTSKWISYCQIAFRAGKVVYGSKLLLSIQKKQACLVVYSNLIGNNSKKKIQDKCHTYQIPYFGVDPDEFDQITKRSFVAFSILDASLAKQIWNDRKGMVMSNGLQQTEEKNESKPKSEKQQSPAAGKES